MIEVTHDILGQPVRVGDRIACAFRVGNTSELRVGTVEAFGQVKDRYSEKGYQDTLIVRWQGAYQPEKPTGIWVSRRQFVRIQ